MCVHTHMCNQSYLILCDPMDCSPAVSSAHGIFQARILELPHPTPFPHWVGDHPNAGIEPMSPVSPVLAGKFFTIKPPGSS